MGVGSGKGVNSRHKGKRKSLKAARKAAKKAAYLAAFNNGSNWKSKKGQKKKDPNRYGRVNERSRNTLYVAKVYKLENQ